MCDTRATSSRRSGSDQVFFTRRNFPRSAGLLVTAADPLSANGSPPSVALTKNSQRKENAHCLWKGNGLNLESRSQYPLSRDAGGWSVNIAGNPIMTKKLQLATAGTIRRTLGRKAPWAGKRRRRPIGRSRAEFRRRILAVEALEPRVVLSAPTAPEPTTLASLAESFPQVTSAGFAEVGEGQSQMLARGAVGQAYDTTQGALGGSGIDILGASMAEGEAAPESNAPLPQAFPRSTTRRFRMSNWSFATTTGATTM